MGNIKVTIEKLFADENKALKAIVGLKIETDIGFFAVHGIRVFENDKGLFVRMPLISHKTSDGSAPLEAFHAVSAEARRSLCEAILQEYEKAIETQKN